VIGEPGVHPRGRGEQRRGANAGEAGEVPLGALDLAFFVELRRRQPLVQDQGVAGGGEYGATVDDA
jgi:hypothetical protein